MNVLEKRAMLRAVTLEKRSAWAKSVNVVCDKCAPLDRICSYPSHWNSAIVDHAYASLCDGTVTTAPTVPPDEADETPAPAPKPAPAKRPPSPIETAIAEVVRDLGIVDKDELARDIIGKVEGLLERKLKSIPPREHVVKIDDHADVVIEGHLHDAFDRVLKRARARIPILLVGPAGSGKTHLAAQVAKALNLPFYFTSVSAGMSEGILTGRLLPTGESGRFEYVRSEFVKAFEEGGVFLADEIDAADANVLVKINAALANGHMAVDNRPEKSVATRHPDFVFIAAANTFGNGADRQYVGRNQLDAATLDRFLVGTVEMDYDKKLEESIVPKHVLDWGWNVRASIYQHGLRRILSTRTLLRILDAEKVGIDASDWRKSIFSGWKADELAKIPSNLK